MRWALVNPPWTFDGSIYFGCREPHLPLEFGYAKALLEQDGHEVTLFDRQLDPGSEPLRAAIERFTPDVTVVTTAPSYLFWRCAPPELRVPQEVVSEIGDRAGTLVAIGPHASTTPGATLRKLGCDVAVLGEPEEILPRLAAARGEWGSVPSIAYMEQGEVRVTGAFHQTDMTRLPALTWSPAALRRHRHHHHRFDQAPDGPGAEMETSRGCPYHCTFCAKDNFRNDYRKRPLETLLDELDGLIAAGATYVYFIDEIFLPNRPLLEAVRDRQIQFGVQTRIDLWQPPMLDLLGAAGCVSVEAGVESISEAGRNLLDKRSKLSTGEITARLVHARRVIPFVQANLLDAQVDDPAVVEAWRQHLIDHGVWANKPVPLFPYPGSPEYLRRWGAADDRAWERAVEHYLASFDEFSDIQEERPLPLPALEAVSPHRHPHAPLDGRR